MLLAMAAMPTIDTALHGKSGTIYGNNIYDNLESQGTQDIYKGSTTSWKPPVDTVGGGSEVKNLKPQSLMDELAKSNVKYNADDVITVVKTPEGKLMWLEKGNDASGLKHIMDGHATDFMNRGVNDVPGFLSRTLQENPVKTGMGARGLFADYLINGKMYRVAYGTNGYVVSFFPLFE